MNNIYSVTPAQNLNYKDLASNLAIMGVKIVSSCEDSVKIEADDYDAGNNKKCRFVGSVSLSASEASESPDLAVAPVENAQEKPKSAFPSFFGGK